MYKVGRWLLKKGLWATLALVCVSGEMFSQECQLATREDVYFLPATEMAGEKSYPQVAILENEAVQVWSVPNRGRLLFNLIRKEPGNSQVVAVTTPLPLSLLGAYTFEFGGVYSTFPWHRRDNQPMPLEMEELKDSDGCAIRMLSKDPETDVALLAELRLPPSGPEVFLGFRLLNPRAIDQVIDFGVVIVARPGGKASADMELRLPVTLVTLGKSDGQWMGEEGAEVAWPAPWSKWGRFEAAGWFHANINAFDEPTIFVYNPEADEHLRIGWEPQELWTSCVLFSWGPAYKQVMGAYDGFRIELRADNLQVPGEGERILELKLTTESGTPFHGLSER